MPIIPTSIWFSTIYLKGNPILEEIESCCVGWDRVLHLSATETLICIIINLQALGVSGTSIHIIGVSLGAHVGGLVGHFHGGQLGRITGIIKLSLGSSPALQGRE